MKFDSNQIEQRAMEAQESGTITVAEVVQQNERPLSKIIIDNLQNDVLGLNKFAERISNNVGLLQVIVDEITNNGKKVNTELLECLQNKDTKLIGFFLSKSQVDKTRFGFLEMLYTVVRRILKSDLTRSEIEAYREQNSECQYYNYKELLDIE